MYIVLVNLTVQIEIRTVQPCPGQIRERKLVPPQEVVLTYPGITVIIRINYPIHPYGRDNS